MLPAHGSGFEPDRRIVITGLGVVSPLGRTVDRFWHALMGADQLPPDAEAGGDVPPKPIGVADFNGRIDNFPELPDAVRKTIRKSLKLMNRETQLGVAAGHQALLDSGVVPGHDPERIGVCFGAENVSIRPDDFQAGVEACTTSAGEFDDERWGTDGLCEVAPLWLLRCLPNMPACHLAIINDLRGPGNTITQRDVAANMAVAEACRSIQCGDADAMVVGATGTTLTTFNRMHAQLEDEVFETGGAAVCRPFDLHRTGPAPGEGAGAVVLEELSCALNRGAPIYGEMLGTASTSRVHRNNVEACQSALSSALRECLRRARLSPADIGHLHAHGLSTRNSDLAEAQAICDVLGESGRTVPVVAAKSHLANAGAGAGAMELVASLLSLRHNRLFPVRNFSEPDPECPVRPVTDDEPAGTNFLNLNVFGRGLASCIAVGSYRE